MTGFGRRAVRPCEGRGGKPPPPIPRPSAIALPHTLLAQMPNNLAILCQSPYHWAAAYGLAALLLVVLSMLPSASDERAT